MSSAFNVGQRFEVISPMGHQVLSEFNAAKQSFEGYVIDKNSGLKYALSDEILEGIEATLRAESFASGAPQEADDWTKTLQEIKNKQAMYLRKLVGQAADFLVIKPQ